jgi:hypothetical protein
MRAYEGNRHDCDSLQDNTKTMYIQILLSGLYVEMEPQNGIQVLYNNML